MYVKRPAPKKRKATGPALDPLEGVPFPPSLIGRPEDQEDEGPPLPPKKKESWGSVKKRYR